MGKKKKAKAKAEPKMKRRRALEICFRLWDWLWENPDKKKYEWIGWKRNGGKIDNILSDCPCCEYTHFLISKAEDNCIYCPLRGQWGGRNKKSKNDCQGLGSHYGMWDRIFIGLKTKKKYAGKIRNAALKELRKYKGNKKFGKLVE